MSHLGLGGHSAGRPLYFHICLTPGDFEGTLLVLTDSGLQEETTVLGVPCITLRPNTERPITCEEGTNILVGNHKDKILTAAQTILNRPGRAGPSGSRKSGMGMRRSGLWRFSALSVRSVLTMPVLRLSKKDLTRIERECES